jgi:hypothetical protein
VAFHTISALGTVQGQIKSHTIKKTRPRGKVRPPGIILRRDRNNSPERENPRTLVLSLIDRRQPSTLQRPNRRVPHRTFKPRADGVQPEDFFNQP